MTQPNLQQLARQGNPKAISKWLNQHLDPHGVKAKVALKEECLHVLLQGSDRVPDRYEFVNLVRAKLTNLELDSVRRVRVYGRQEGQDKPAWSQEFALSVGAYSQLLFEQAHDSAGGEDTSDPTPPPPPPPPKHEKRQIVVKIILATIALIVVVGVSFGVLLVLEQSESPATDPSPATTD